MPHLTYASPVDVVVTGGSGFVGNAVVQVLLSEGWSPRLLLRRTAAPAPGRPTRSLPSLPHGVTSVVVDFSRPEALAAACQGAAAVIHLIGIIAELGANTFESAHVGLTQTVLKATQDAGIRRYVHMSALGTRPGARSRYHQTKWAAEQRVQSSGLDWTIFRPSLIYGPEDAFTRLFARLSRFAPALPAIGGGRGRMQPIGVEPVAQAFVRALRQPASHQRTYDLCGPERLEFREILRAILSACHRRRAIVPIPFPMARLQARVLEFWWPRILHRAPPLSRDQILMLEEDNIGDGRAADAQFGLVHTPFQVALNRQFDPRKA